VAGPGSTAENSNTDPTALLSRAGQRPVKAGQQAQWALPLLSGGQPMLLGIIGQEVVLATAAGKVVRPLYALPQSVTEDSAWTPLAAAALAGGSQLIVVEGNTAIESVDMRSGSARQVAAAVPGAFACGTVVSPDGTAAIVLECPVGPDPIPETQVVYHDLRTGKSRLLERHADAIALTAGNLLIQEDSGALEVRDGTGKTLVRDIPGTGGVTDALAVSPDGTVIARLRDDGTVFLSDAATGSLLTSITLPTPVDSSSPDYWSQTALAFTADGRYLLSATAGGEVYRWDLSLPELARDVCRTVGRPLTSAEWWQYVGTSPPARLPCAS
jgi:WD40 repeat protein